MEGQKRGASPDEAPDAFVRQRAEIYVRHAGNARAAYEAHKGPKASIRYEDLRSDTLHTMRILYSALGIPFDEKELSRAVEKHSWENISPDKKGEGKFYRKATPKGWREDLTLEQVGQIEQITAPLLEEFYPDSVV